MTSYSGVLWTSFLGVDNTHVVLPGTVWSEESGERGNLYFSQSRKVDHIVILHDVTERNMAEMLDRYVGLDWEERIDTLEALRDEQKQIIHEEPHGIGLLDDEPVQFWGGVRQTDEHHCAIGCYLPIDDEIVFRPVASGMSREQAERLSALVTAALRDYPDADQLALYREMIKILLDEGFDDIAPPEPPSTGPSFDMDL